MKPEITPIPSRLPADGWCIHFADRVTARPEITAGPLTGMAREECSDRLVLLADTALLRPGEADRKAAEILKKWCAGTPVAKLWRELTGVGTLLLWYGSRRLLYFGTDRLGGGMGAVRLNGEALTLANTLAAPRLCEHAELSFQAIHDYLSLQYVPEGTVFSAVTRLKGGRCLCLDLAHGQEYQEQWDTVCLRSDRFLPEREAVSLLRERVTDAVRKLLELGGEQIGVLLSGGVDSAIVAGVAASLAGRPLRACTVGFSEKNYDERDRADASARLIAQATGHPLKRHVWEVTAGEWPHFAELLKKYGEPYGDASLLATAELVRHAAEEGAEFLLSGDAADELFGGYERYRFMKMTNLVPALPGVSVLAGLLPDGGERTLAGRFKRLIPALARSGLPRYLRLLDRFPAAEKLELYGSRIRASARSLKPTSRLLLPRDPVLPGISPYQQWDVEHYMPGDVLVKTALAAADAGVPVLTPFLERGVMELALRLPESLKIRGDQRKYLLAKVFPEFVPPVLAHRRKTGFGVPVSAWLRGPWKGILQENLLEGTLVKEEYFRRAVVEKWITEHLSGRRDRSYGLWSLLTLEVSLANRQKNP